MISPLRIVGCMLQPGARSARAVLRPAASRAPGRIAASQRSPRSRVPSYEADDARIRDERELEAGQAIDDALEELQREVQARSIVKWRKAAGKQTRHGGRARERTGGIPAAVDQKKDSRQRCRC